MIFSRVLFEGALFPQKKLTTFLVVTFKPTAAYYTERSNVKRAAWEKFGSLSLPPKEASRGTTSTMVNPALVARLPLLMLIKLSKISSLL